MAQTKFPLDIKVRELGNEGIKRKPYEWKYEGVLIRIMYSCKRL